MFVNCDRIGGEILRDTEVYQVEDNSTLDHLTLSKTTLYPGKETRGHSHAGKDEVYFFHQGQGMIQLDEDKRPGSLNQEPERQSSFRPVKSGDIVLIPNGAFHKVFNTGDESLVFICVFEKYQREN